MSVITPPDQPCLGTCCSEHVAFTSSIPAMADTFLPPPAEQVRPWYSAGPRAAESETWQSLAVSLPDDPSIPVDVTPLVAAHFDFQDVSY